MLEFDGLTERYGEKVALRDLSFAVRPGEMFGFVGANGAGRTTAMRIALGVLAADAGQVRWRGQPVTFEMRRRFGYMPAERGLYPKMRVAEQLEYFARLHGLDQAAATAAVDGDADPPGGRRRAAVGGRPVHRADAPRRGRADPRRRPHLRRRDPAQRSEGQAEGRPRRGREPTRVS